MARALLDEADIGVAAAIATALSQCSVAEM
jgi:hypothetical protein